MLSLMLTRADAHRLAVQYVALMAPELAEGDELVVVDEHTIERSWGGCSSIPRASGRKPESSSTLSLETLLYLSSVRQERFWFSGLRWLRRSISRLMSEPEIPTRRCADDGNMPIDMDAQQQAAALVAVAVRRSSSR